MEIRNTLFEGNEATSFGAYGNGGRCALTCAYGTVRLQCATVDLAFYNKFKALLGRVNMMLIVELVEMMRELVGSRCSVNYISKGLSVNRNTFGLQRRATGVRSLLVFVYWPMDCPFMES